MIRTDLENIINNSKLVEFVKINGDYTPEEIQVLRKNLVSELATDIEVEYFEQDGIEPSEMEQITTKPLYAERF